MPDWPQYGLTTRKISPSPWDLTFIAKTSNGVWASKYLYTTQVHPRPEYCVRIPATTWRWYKLVFNVGQFESLSQPLYHINPCCSRPNLIQDGGGIEDLVGADMNHMMPSLQESTHLWQPWRFFFVASGHFLCISQDFNLWNTQSRVCYTSRIQGGL
jgi:hypothetical protein